jgi:hypothetical protein
MKNQIEIDFENLLDHMTVSDLYLLHALTYECEAGGIAVDKYIDKRLGR